MKVAVFGDLYARDNHVINQDLIHFIGENGGEVLTTPYSEYVKMISGPYLRKWLIEGHYLSVLSSQALFVQASPAFCCPALITGAMAHEIERQTGVPVVSITYDGAGGRQNDVIIPYLKYARWERSADKSELHRRLG